MFLFFSGDDDIKLFNIIYSVDNFITSLYISGHVGSNFEQNLSQFMKVIIFSNLFSFITSFFGGSMLFVDSSDVYDCSWVFIKDIIVNIMNIYIFICNKKAIFFIFK